MFRHCHISSSCVLTTQTTSQVKREKKYHIQIQNYRKICFCFSEHINWCNLSLIKYKKYSKETIFFLPTVDIFMEKDYD